MVRRGGQRTQRPGSGRDSKKLDRACDVLDCGGDLLDCVPGCDLFLLLPAALRVALGAFRASAAPIEPPRRLGSRAAARLVRSYQLNISAHRPAVCNLSPTCSQYGLRVLGEHGVLRAGRLIQRRLRSCRAAGRSRRGGN